MYCAEPEKIENFEKALADNFVGWEVHHRMETHNSDGERREVDITRAELKALDMYYNRPASELIYLTKSEHNSLHKKGNTYTRGKRHSDEAKKKMSLAKKEMYKGENNPFYGKHHTVESKKKISEAAKSISEETRKKMSEAAKNRSKEHKTKISEAQTGRHWYNNGKVNKFCRECPEGFVTGLLRK